MNNAIKQADGFHAAARAVKACIQAGQSPVFTTESYAESVLGQMIEYGWVCEAKAGEGVEILGARIALTAKGAAETR